MSTLSASDFEFVRLLLYTQAAIVLEAGKEYLVEARLTPLAARERFKSLVEFIGALRSERVHGPLQSKAVDALTTNETYFFRDVHPFDALRETILPELIAAATMTRRITIWCAACSTGQEPYSIAMLIRENFPQLASWQVEIIATDISPRVLSQADEGRYNEVEIHRGLPQPYLEKYFTGVGGAWVVKPEIRQMVKFQPLNLIQPWPIMPSCDLIFMRNVMIYFDIETKRTILTKLQRCLNKSGSLVLGSSETTLNLDPYWAPVTHGPTVVYRPAVHVGGS